MIALEVLEEGEQAVRWPVAPGTPVGGCDAVKGALFDRQVGVQVDVRRALLLVAKPQRDGGRVDAGVEEHHRGGVAQYVHRDSLGVQRRTPGLRGADVLGETTLDRVACQWSAGSGGEQRVGRQAGALARPYFEDGDGLAGERR